MALEPQPADPGHPQVLVPYLYPVGDGEAILVGVLAFEQRIAALTLEAGLERIRQVLQAVPHRLETVLLQPGVLRIPSEGREFLAQAEKGDLGLSPFGTDLVVLPTPVGPVLLLLPGQHVVPDEPAGPRRAGQLVGAGAALG